jgi:hypothetical protein
LRDLAISSGHGRIVERSRWGGCRRAYEFDMANQSLEVSMERAAEAVRLRLERWRRVRHLLDRAEAATGRLERECTQAAATELQLLAADESRWTYPSAARVQELRRVLESGDRAAAAEEARAIAAVLEVAYD